jgi:hypothetical protein
MAQQHASGQFIYAAPDCPEVYFLTGLRNPTRTLFDFFDEQEGRTQRILNAIQNHHVNVIVVASQQPFSPPIAPDLLSALKDQFPQSAKVGRFVVRWR